MTTVFTSQQEIIHQLRKNHEERQKVLKKLTMLGDSEAELMMQLQEQSGINAVVIPDFSMFKDTTRRLLIEFWIAPNRMLSHEDIRQDVMFDNEAKISAIWQVISRANAELSKMKFCFEIKNMKKRGYQLVDKILTKCNQQVIRHKNS
jgi:hypothetical protein